MPNRYWLIILIYVVTQLSVIIGGPLLFVMFPHLTDTEAAIYWNLFSTTIAILFILHLLKPDMKQASMRSGPTIGTMIKWTILGFLLAYLAQIVANMITIELIGIDEPSQNTEDIMSLVEVNILFIVAIVLFAPITEEIIFRKIIFGELYKRVNFFIAAIISSLIFAVLHGDFDFLLSYIAMGLVFAYLYIKTKRIIVPIMVHALMNSFVVVINLFVDIEDLERRLQEYENALFIFFGG